MLTILALLPTIVLMVFIYNNDRVEKEPLPLLFKLFALGMVSVIPVLILELLFGFLLGMILEPGSGLYVFAEVFFGVALIEEYWKRWAACQGAWKHPAFNYRFDAVVYCVFSALGFAAVENVIYVLNWGLATAIARAITAVPAHAIDGVIMGCFLGEAKLREKCRDTAGMKHYLRLSLLIPMLAHGIYDYALSVESGFAGLFFMGFVVCVDIWAIRYIRRASLEDCRVQPLREVEEGCMSGYEKN